MFILLPEWNSFKKEKAMQNNLDFKMDFNDNTKSCNDKVKEQNRIRQIAFKVRAKMPKDYKSFMQVATHLIKNAHRYHSAEELNNADITVKNEVKLEIKKDLTELNCKEINKQLRVI